MPPLDYLLLGAAVLLLLGVIASKISSWLGVPALLLFLLLGMVFGSEGPGGIYFDDAQLAQSLGVIALAYILFSGGLDTDWKSVRPVIGHGLVLSTLGVLLTAFIVALFTRFLLGFSWPEGMLTGAIVGSTDAAAVFAVLRSKGVRLRGYLKPLLEFESGSNDPMAIFLTIGMIRLIQEPATTLPDIGVLFIQQLVIGALAGIGGGLIIVEVINRLRLEYEGLYTVVTIAFVLFLYGLTDMIGGSPFLAVYVAGLILGNRDFIHKQSLKNFHDSIAWLMQIVMFLALGLLVFPSQLLAVTGSGLLISLALMLVARPVSVFATLIPFHMEIREKLFAAWVGLRGATPIILATFPLLADVPRDATIFNLVFFIVLTSVLLQGTTLPLAAKLLGVADTTPPRRPALDLPRVTGLRNELQEIVITPDSPAAGRRVLDLGLPEGSLIVLIDRDGEHLVPSGSTVLQPGDVVLILSDQELIPEIQNIFA